MYIEQLGGIDLTAMYKITTGERMLTNWRSNMSGLSDPRLPACSRKAGHLLETCCTIMDMKGVGITRAPQVYSYIKQASALSQNYYPERLGRFYLINAPWGFSGVWSVVKGWLDPVTVAKIHILGASYQKDLFEQIPPRTCQKLRRLMRVRRRLRVQRHGALEGPRVGPPVLVGEEEGRRRRRRRRPGAPVKEGGAAADGAAAHHLLLLLPLLTTPRRPRRLEIAAVPLRGKGLARCVLATAAAAAAAAPANHCHYYYYHYGCCTASGDPVQANKTDRQPGKTGGNPER